MIKSLKFSRKAIPATMIALVAFSVLLPVLATDQAAFNTHPSDKKTLKVGTNVQGCSECWRDSMTTAGDGDVVSVSLYYHNNSNVDAENTRVRIVPNQTHYYDEGTGQNVTITGRIWADNCVRGASDSVTVRAESGERITGLEPVAVMWYPDRSMTAYETWTGSEARDIITGNGISLGDIAPGWDTAGHVVARFEVETEGNGGGEGDEPEVETLSATNVDEDSATLRCEVDANGEDTDVWFEWGEDDDDLDEETSDTTVDGSETNEIVSKSISGLDEDTRYYYRCVGENSEGTDYGSVRSFTTNENGGGDDDLQATTEDAEDINHDDALLVCDVDGTNGEDTEVWFEYGEDDDDLDEDSRREDVDDDGEVRIRISDLDEDTRYYYRCRAENDEDEDTGSIKSFRTDDEGDSGDRPEATTLSADRVDEDSARLRCDVDTNGDDAEAWFEWGEDDDDLDEDTSKVDVDSNETNERVTKTISNLDKNEKYYFRCVVEDDGGERDRGSIKSFTTDRDGGGDGPDVTTLAPTGVTQTSATLEGEVDANGEDTEVWFEWGTSISNLNRDTSKDDVGDKDNIKFDSTITGLSAQTTYYYRAVAENDEDKDYGSIRSFRTGSQVINVITRVVEVFREVEEEPEVEALIITLDADRKGGEDSRDIEYTVSYDNRTDETFTDAVLIVDLPRELDFVDADPNADDERGDELIWEIGTIEPGEEDSFVIETEVDADIDEDEEIRFVADVEYTDDDTRKIVTVIDEHTFGELSGRTGGAFTALLIDGLRDFFTSPILWLILLALLIYFAIRYFVAGRDRRSAALV